MDGETRESDQDERRRRIERLGALAGQQAQERQDQEGGQRQAPSAATIPAQAARARGGRLAARTGTRGGRRFWLGVGAAALAVCVVVAGVLVWVHQTHPAGRAARPIPDPLAIRLDPEFSCPTEVAWSPDGARVAVLGYRNCPSNSGSSGASVYQYGAIYVYDARAGVLLTHIQLDASVIPVAAAHPATTAQGQPNVLLGYSDLIWSPDGRRLAVQYGALAFEYNGLPNSMTDLGTGLLLADPDKGAVQVLPPLAALPAVGPILGSLYSGTPPNPYPRSSFQPVRALRWDLTAGTGSLVQVPLAAGYAWGANGTLQPASSLPASPDATPGPASQGAIGNASGGASFTMWQAGEVAYPQFCTDVPFNGGTSVDCCPVTAFYTASLGVPAAWSPDGRYLVQAPVGPLGANGKIAQALAPATTAAQGGCADAALASTLAPLPVRDAGLRAALAGLVPPWQNLNPTQGPSIAQLAWSPDGRRLAVGYAQNAGSQPGGVTLFDCASGKRLGSFSSGALLAQVPEYERERGTDPQVVALVWSPDSQRLALLDPSHSALVILGAKSLGATA